MNRDWIESSGKLVKRKARKKWGKASHDERDFVEGKRDEFVGRIQSRYGKARDVAKREVDEWAEQIE